MLPAWPLKVLSSALGLTAPVRLVVECIRQGRYAYMLWNLMPYILSVPATNESGPRLSESSNPPSPFASESTGSHKS